MTFDDVKKFAKKKDLVVDENSIQIHDYRIYEQGYIWLNAHTFSEKNMSIHYLIASKRTPEQMKKFIESLL